MKRSLTVVCAALLFSTGPLQAVTPQKWELRRLEDFLKGKFEGLSVSYDGVLSLSPQEERIEGPAEEFYLSFLLDSEGTIYLGTGHGGNVYRIEKGGKPELYFSVAEMDIYCLAKGQDGNLYAGTSPNGKIYKITAKGSGEPFFNPQEKYIWDLMFAEKGNLLAAVGESGGIYEINPKGEGTQVLKAEENHILCLRKDRNGDLIAGSGGRGRLYRLSQGHKASIVFESADEEIRSIAMDEEGNIYVASGGLISMPKKEAAALTPRDSETSVSVSATPSLGRLGEISSPVLEQPSALYKVSPSGLAEKLWESDEDLIYSVVWDQTGRRVIFGTGNKGRIFACDKDKKISLLLQKDSEQVYLLFLPPQKPEAYALSNNPAGLNILRSDLRSSGDYVSETFDTKTLSTWGMIRWEAEVPAGTILQFQTRTGNSSKPDQTWSDWSPPYQKKEGEQILSPKARFVQLKINLRVQTGKASPLIRQVSLFYLQTNLPPSVTVLNLHPVNEVFLKPPEQEEVIWGLEVNPSQQARDSDKASTFVVAKKVSRKGYQTVTWDASDENGDSLIYSVFIRKKEEAKWRLLKDRWPEKIFAFDTPSFPDGEYLVKVEASDIPSNPVGTELKSERISRILVLDNSLPVIKDFQAVRDKNRLKVSFVVEDSFSAIKEVKFLIRPDEWRSVFPLDGICDSKAERFSFELTLPANPDNLIVVKAWDAQDNAGVYRQEF